MRALCAGKMKYVGLLAATPLRILAESKSLHPRSSALFMARLAIASTRKATTPTAFNNHKADVHRPHISSRAREQDFCIPKSHFKSSAFTLQAENEQSSGLSSTKVLLDKVFPERLGSMTTHERAAGHMADLMDMLMKSHYSTLIEQYSWMHKNVHIAFIQLFLNDMVQDEMRAVQLHPNFAALRSHVISIHKHMDDEALLKTAVAALYLGEEPTDRFVHQLVLDIRSRVPTTSISNLGSVSQILKTVPGFDVFMIRALCKRLDEVVQAGVDPNSTAEDYQSLCTAMVNTLRYVSKDLIGTFLSYLEYVIEKHSAEQWLCNPDYIGMLASVLQKMWFRSKHNGFQKQTSAVVDRLVEACYETAHQFECHNIAEVCHALKGMRRYEYDLSLVLQRRASQLLTDDCQLGDLSNLCYCITPKADDDLKRTLQMRLLSKLRSEMPDIIIISNLASSLPDLGYITKDLLILYQHLIAVNADRIVRYISRYDKVSRFLQRKKFINRDAEMKFVETLSRHLDLRHGLGVYSFSSIATFMLPSYTDSLPIVLYQKLKEGIPGWKDHDIYRLAIGLHGMKRPVSRRMRQQIDEIQLLLYSTMLEKVEHVDNLDKLISLTFRFCVQNKLLRDPTLTSKLMDKFPEFSGDLSTDNMFRVVQTFHTLKYHLPGIYDDLTQLSLENAEHLDAQQILAVLKALARVGYQPHKFDSFALFCLDAFAHFEEYHQYEKMLETALSLVHLSYQPEEELSRVFTLDFIQTLDKHMSGQKGTSVHTTELMMELNRAVVLECPQLEVPWFHEHYCCQHLVTDEPDDDAALTRFRDEVHAMMVEVLGSEELVRRWVYSPYFYTIDMECVLDENNQAVSTTEISDTGVSKSLQRVATLALGEDCYCYNSKELDGRTQTKVRHLELMDYRVVQVPHYEWYSMGLSEWQAKADYLQDKVLDQSDSHSQ